jgi:hypothetical protein
VKCLSVDYEFRLVADLRTPTEIPWARVMVIITLISPMRLVQSFSKSPDQYPEWVRRTITIILTVTTNFEYNHDFEAILGVIYI